jgi:hypothetical protein
MYKLTRVPTLSNTAVFLAVGQHYFIIRHNLVKLLLIMLSIIRFYGGR